jgi:outer membrane protein assembly factor BamB
MRWRANIGEGEMSTPAAADGIVALTHGPPDLSVPHELVTLDAAAGVVLRRWPMPTGERAFLGALVDGVAWTVGEDGLVRSVDVTAADAALQPRFDAGAPVGSLATVVGDTIYIASTDGAIRALDRVTAAERWVREVEGSPTIPVVVDGRVYVGTTLGKAVALADAPTDSRE